MARNLLRTSISALILSLFLGAVSVDAYQIEQLSLDAQNDFVVQPGKTEIFINPGETITKNVSITNRTNRKVTFRVKPEDFVGSTDPESPVILYDDDRESPYSLKNFIKPELDQFTLGLGEKITFSVTISVPADMEPGGNYGAIVVSNVPNVDANGNEQEVSGGAKIISRIASLFLVRVNGPVVESGSIQDFKIAGPDQSLFGSMPQNYEIVFKNDGSVHLVPYGTIEVKNLFGKKVAIIPVDAYFALPDSVRYREVALTKSMFAFGRYTADLSLYKGFGNQFENRTISFWVIPWKVLTIAIIVLILLVLFMRSFFSRFEFRRK